jgi:hypothetical protein
MNKESYSIINNTEMFCKGNPTDLHVFPYTNLAHETNIRDRTSLHVLKNKKQHYTTFVHKVPRLDLIFWLR